jgi:starch synthase
MHGRGKIVSKRILFVTSELYPYVKTGGLGDVSSSLPLALQKGGTDIRLFVPGYPNILKSLSNFIEIASFPVYFGAPDMRILFGKLSNGMAAYVLKADAFFDRASPYVDAAGRDWPDNHLRFAAFCRAAADLYLFDKAWQPDLIHCNDWQTGLIPAYLSERPGPKPATAMTIHNLAYQGLFPAHVFGQLGLPRNSFAMNGVEFHGQVGFLKAGLYYADQLTTVSPTYAREILTPEYGCGLDGLLRSREHNLSGILNGIDQDVWNPQTDPYLERRYDSEALRGRDKNKESLLRNFGLNAAPQQPLFAVIGRLTPQKGFDLVLDAVPNLLRQNASVIFMGQGEAGLENRIRDLAKANPGRVAAHIGYNEVMEHRLHGGADAVIMPSRFEPCGLVQLYSLRYGSLPIVRRTGGLADTVINAGMKAFNTSGTGLMFEEANSAVLQNTLMRTIGLYRNRRAWRRMQRNAMAQDFSWTVAAGKYASLYQATAA